MGPGPGVPAIVPSAGPCSGTSFPPRGPVGPVPPLPRYYEVLRLLSVLPAALRCLRLAVPPVRRFFAPADEPRVADGPGVWSSVPRPTLSGGDAQVSQVPGEPSRVHALLFDPGETSVPGLPRHLDAAFRAVNGVGSRSDQTDGAPSHGLHAPCVRFAAGIAPAPRNTRFRRVANLCRAGLITRRVPTKVSAITNRPWLPPPPGFPGALTSSVTGTCHPPIHDATMRPTESRPSLTASLGRTPPRRGTQAGGDPTRPPPTPGTVRGTAPVSRHASRPQRRRVAAERASRA